MDALVWHDKPRDGAQNMAIDESMAQVAASSDCLILRVYYWKRPFLSLGYFQSANDRLADRLVRDLPYTRRLSGGGAIIHDQEITYSLAIADQSGSKSPANLIYTQVHAAICESLQTFGFDARTAAELGVASKSKTDSSEPFLCFQRRADADLIVEGHKIVGSAQRRISGVLLQHGSILLSASHSAPGLLGLTDLGSESNGKFQGFADSLATDLIKRFQANLGRCIPINSWRNRDESNSDKLSTIADNVRRLVDEKYNSLSWKDKR